MVTDTEYLERHEALHIELAVAQERLEKADKAKATFEPAQVLSFFLFQAKKCFEASDDKGKRRLLEILCSNPSLKDRKALLQAKKPFDEIRDLANSAGGAGPDQTSEPQLTAILP